MSEWTTERMRAMDRAVAEARGWQPFPYAIAGAPDSQAWCPPGEPVHISTATRALPPVSLGCRETFALMEAFRNVTWELRQDRLGRFLFAWITGEEWGAPVAGPTMAIAICLAYLAAKGVPFNG